MYVAYTLLYNCIDNRGVAEEIFEGGTIVPPSQGFGNRNLTFFPLLGYRRRRVIKHGFRVVARGSLVAHVRHESHLFPGVLPVRILLGPCDDLSDAVGGVNGGGLCGDGGLGG